MTDAGTRVGQAKASARSLATMGAILTPVLGAAVGLPLIGRLFLGVTEPPDGGAGRAGHIAVLVAEALPGVLLVVAVAALVGVFREYQNGRFLSAAASRSFRRAGTWGLASFLSKILVVPAVSVLAGQRGVETLFDVSSFDTGLLVFAAFVLSAGTVLESAAASIQAENDEII